MRKGATEGSSILSQTSGKGNEHESLGPSPLQTRDRSLEPFSLDSPMYPSFSRGF